MVSEFDQIDKIISKHKEAIRLLLRLKNTLPQPRYTTRTVEDAWGQPMVVRTPIEGSLEKTQKNCRKRIVR